MPRVPRPLTLLSTMLVAASIVTACGDDEQRPAAGAGDPATAERRDSPASVSALGERAPSAEADAAFAVARRYLAAYAAGNWERACELMSVRMRRRLARTVGRHPKLEGEDCVGIMAALAGKLPAALRKRQAATTRFTELRVDGDRGHAIFRNALTPRGSVRMSREGGKWRVAAAAGSPL